MKILLLDLETNGLSCEDEVINFGALEIDENFNIIKEYNRFYFLNKQEENTEATAIHKLTQTKIKELREQQKANYAKFFKDDLEIKKLIESVDYFVGYNLESFDLNFIKEHLNPNFKRVLNKKWVEFTAGRTEKEIEEIYNDYTYISRNREELLKFYTEDELDELTFLLPEKYEDLKIFDVMHKITNICKVAYNDYYKNYKWPKLSEALEFFDESFKSLNLQQHTALSDCRATLFIIKKLFIFDKEKKEFVENESEIKRYMELDELRKKMREENYFKKIKKLSEIEDEDIPF